MGVNRALRLETPEGVPKVYGQDLVSSRHNNEPLMVKTILLNISFCSRHQRLFYHLRVGKGKKKTLHSCSCFVLMVLISTAFLFSS